MHLNLALCYLKLEKVVDARHECEKVLEADPENVKALFRKGLVSICMCCLISVVHLAFFQEVHIILFPELISMPSFVFGCVSPECFSYARTILFLQVSSIICITQAIFK